MDPRQDGCVFSSIGGLIDDEDDGASVRDREGSHCTNRYVVELMLVNACDIYFPWMARSSYPDTLFSCNDPIGSSIHKSIVLSRLGYVFGY